MTHDNNETFRVQKKTKRTGSNTHLLAIPLINNNINDMYLHYILTI